MQFPIQASVLPFVYFSACFGELQGKQIPGDELGGVRLGRCNGNFGARHRIEYQIRLSGDCRAAHVDDGKRFHSPPFRLAQSGETVRRLPRLTDDHDESLFRQQRIFIAKLRGKLHPNGKFRKPLDRVRRRHACVIGGPARYDIQPLDLPQFGLGQSHSLEGTQGVSDGLGLFVNFLQHKVGIATLLRPFGAPRDFRRRFSDGVPRLIEKLHARPRQPHRLPVVYVIDFACEGEQRRNVRGKVSFPFPHADDERTVLARRVNLVGIPLKQDGDGVRAPCSLGKLSQGDQGRLSKSKAACEEVGDYLRVRLGTKGIAER